MLTVKILCPCGVKFAFDVEPVRGRMPSTVNCPACGLDATSLGDEAIAAQLAQAQPVPAGARVAPIASPGGASAPALEVCARHQGPAAANCVVCQKPICLECMEQFGFLCSAYCKEQASRKKIAVPPYEGQKRTVVARQDRKLKHVALIAATAITLFLGLHLYYRLVASKPKARFQLKAESKTPFLSAHWAAAEKVLAISVDRVSLHDASSGKTIWESPFKEDEKPSLPKYMATETEDDQTAFLAGTDLPVKVAGNEFWVFHPKKAVRYEVASGKRKLEVALPHAAEETYMGDEIFLSVAEPNAAARVYSRLTLASGQLQSISITQAVARAVRPARSALLGDDDDGPMLQQNSSKILISGAHPIEMRVRMIEKRVQIIEAARPKSSVLDSPNLRASQGNLAAEEFLAQHSGPAIDDQSRYYVTLHRPFSGERPWGEEVVGRPGFYPLRSVDVLIAGKTVQVFGKQGQRMWQAKLSYGMYPRFQWGDDAPCFESGARLYISDQGTLTAFDLRSGEVRWRLQSVGITQVAADSAGKIYVATTDASIDQIRPGREIELSDRIHPVIMKVEPSTGAILWQISRVGDSVYPAGKFLYVTRGQISRWDVLSNALNGGESGTPIHHRIHRLDPETGQALWEYYRPKPPNLIDPRGNRILLQYPDEIRMLKFFSL